MKNIILASSSSIHGSDYLEYILNELTILFKDTKEILFIPYARPSGISYDDYTNIASAAFSKINKSVKGIHHYESPQKAIENATGIFVGGGNTFVLINQLYKNNLVSCLKETIIKGVPFLGTSAGSNICGLTIKTTNDMPIVYPPSFNSLGLVPFNINAHYLNPDQNSKHQGETRATRIKEFHHFNTQPVIGLREGSWIQIKNSDIILKGSLNARVFEYNKPAYNIKTGTLLNALK